MNSIPTRALLSLVLLAAALRAEDPKPEAPKPANADWTLIFRDLQAADNVVKEAAASAFARALEDPAKASKKPYFAQFKADLSAADESAKANALLNATNTALMFQNNRRHFPEVMKELLGADEKIRAARVESIYKALEVNLQSSHASNLIDKLGDEDPKVQAKAEEGLRAMKGDAADDLATGLDEEKVAVKKKCAELLRDLGPDAKDGIDTLLFKLRDEDDKLGRKLAATTLEALGPNAADAVDTLKDNLDDEDKILRKLSVTILKKLGPPVYKAVAVELIDLYLQHAEQAVRNSAADLLLALGADAKEGVKELIDIVEDAPVAAPVPNTPPPAAVAAQTADANSKLLAVKILASIGPDAKEALPALKKLEATAADPELKAAAKEALDKIAPEKK